MFGKNKKCDRLFCSNRCPKKYRYCYSCAKNDSEMGVLGWLLLVIIVAATIF